MIKSLFIKFFLFLCISSTSLAEIINVNNKQIKELLAENIPVVDIRTSTEWEQTGIIPNSVLLTFFEKNGAYDFEKWNTKLDSIIDTNKPFILICRSGRRTKIISEMINKNYDKVIYNAEFGINSWLQSNLKTIKP